MDSLQDTEWDILISGTGIFQSLLALAFSRSDKKVLHVDKHDFYGGAEAALTLQEAEEWATEASKYFRGARISTSQSADPNAPKLSFPRAYSLALAPQVIYSDSALLKALVSSKIYRQIEFQALGAWWIYSADKLTRVPTSREDVAFADSSTIDMRSRRAVMKILRFIVSYEEQPEIWQPFAKKPFKSFLVENFKLKPEQTTIVDLFLGLTLSVKKSEEILTEEALGLVARHIRSIGRLGAGFNAVVPKWGGLAEITQVACRAQAVGGGVYVLGTGVADVSDSNAENYPIQVRLSNGDVVKAKCIVGSEDESLSPNDADSESVDEEVVHRSISVVSNPLTALLPPVNETVTSVGTVVVIPEKSLLPDSPSVYLIIHGSATGECPKDQSIIYATSSDPLVLDKAISALFSSLPDEKERETCQVMYTLRYSQSHRVSNEKAEQKPNVFSFPSAPLDLIFNDEVLETVKSTWRAILCQDRGAEVADDQFLVFEDRKGEVYDDEDGPEL